MLEIRDAIRQNQLFEISFESNFFGLEFHEDLDLEKVDFEEARNQFEIVGLERVFYEILLY